MDEQNWLGQFLRDRRALVAVAIVAACFLPFIGSGNATTSLIGVQGQVNAASQALGLLGRLSAATGGPSTGSMTGALQVLLVLYVVPLSAVLVVGMAFASRGTRLWGVVNGAVAVILPFLVPALASSMFMSGLPEQLRQLLDRQNTMSLTSYGVGVWVIVLLGIAQLFLSVRPTHR